MRGEDVDQEATRLLAQGFKRVIRVCTLDETKASALQILHVDVPEQ